MSTQRWACQGAWLKPTSSVLSIAVRNMLMTSLIPMGLLVMCRGFWWIFSSFIQSHHSSMWYWPAAGQRCIVLRSKGGLESQWLLFRNPKLVSGGRPNLVWKCMGYVLFQLSIPGTMLYIDFLVGIVLRPVCNILCIYLYKISTALSIPNWTSWVVGDFEPLIVDV